MKPLVEYWNWVWCSEITTFTNSVTSKTSLLSGADVFVGHKILSVEFNKCSKVYGHLSCLAPPQSICLSVSSVHIDMISRKVVNKFLRYFSEDAWALDKRHSKDDVVSDAGQIFAYLLFMKWQCLLWLQTKKHNNVTNNNKNLPSVAVMGIYHYNAIPLEWMKAYFNLMWRIRVRFTVKNTEYPPEDIPRILPGYPLENIWKLALTRRPTPDHPTIGR